MQLQKKSSETMVEAMLLPEEEEQVTLALTWRIGSEVAEGGECSIPSSPAFMLLLYLWTVRV